MSISKVYHGAVTVNPTVQSIGRVIDVVRSCEGMESAHEIMSLIRSQVSAVRSQGRHYFHEGTCVFSLKE